LKPLEAATNAAPQFNMEVSLFNIEVKDPTVIVAKWGQDE